MTRAWYALILSHVALAQRQFWQIDTSLDSGCEYTSNSNCLQSKNYPATYKTTGQGQDGCEVDIKASDWVGKVIHVERFDVQRCCDKVHINGLEYDIEGPQGVRPTGRLRWIHDRAAPPTPPTGWKFCPVDGEPPTPAPAPSASSGGGGSGDSGGSPVVLIVIICAAVAVCLIGGGVVYFCFMRKKQPPPAPAPSVHQDPPKTVGASASPAPPAMMEVPQKLDADLEAETATGAWKLPPRRFSDRLTDEELAFPRYWKNQTRGEKFDKLESLDNATEAALQALLTSTFKSGIKTRDRTGAVPTGMKVVTAHRIENSELWDKYATGRHAILKKRPHKCTQVDRISGEVATLGDLPRDHKPSLRRDINECFLWHGTSPHGANGIRRTGLELRYSGTSVGSMYGPGLYLAECSSKSDEYAKDDNDGTFQGCFCMILCRTVLGEVLHMSAGGESTHGGIKAMIEGETYDSVLGDREASVGTYREFVVYYEDMVYPEYLIIYKRTF